jgi:hypothetical protein
MASESQIAWIAGPVAGPTLADLEIGIEAL